MLNTSNMKYWKLLTNFLLIFFIFSGCSNGKSEAEQRRDQRAYKSLKIFFGENTLRVKVNYACLQVIVIPKHGCAGCISTAESLAISNRWPKTLFITDSKILSSVTKDNIINAERVSEYSFVSGSNPIIMQIENDKLVYYGYITPRPEEYLDKINEFEKKCASKIYACYRRGIFCFD